MDLSLDSRAHWREWLVRQLAQLLEEPEVEICSLSDEEDLLGYGLDSIRLMYLQERIRAQGVKVEFPVLSRNPRLGAWLDLLPELLEGVPEKLVNTPLPSSYVQGEPFELTPVQQAYWLGRSSDEVLGGIGCHAFLEFRCRHVDPTRLEEATATVRARNPMLRARFVDGLQQVLEQPTMPCFHRDDWRDLDEERAQQAWQRLHAYRSHECLSVEHGQVFLLGLVQMPDGEDRVWISVDLLAADVESLRLLLQELGMAYNAPMAMPEPPAVQFAEHLLTRQLLVADKRSQAREYWLNRLPELPDGPRLPLACAPQDIKQQRWLRRSFVLGLADSRRLESLSASHGVTLSSVFGWAFATVLGRWSEEQKFLLNVPLFNRHSSDPEIARVIADFTTLVLLECEWKSGLSIAEAVAAFQQSMHVAIGESEFPALEVLRESRRRGQERSAPVVFSSNLGSGCFVPGVFRAVFGDLHDMLSQTPQVWLDHQLYRVERGILVTWDSVEALFPSGVLDAMFASYVQLLRRLSDGDWMSPAHVPLPSAQIARMMDGCTLPQARRLQCLHAGFFEWARKHPNEVAVWDCGQPVTRGALAHRARCMAAGLREEGVGYGDVVEVCLPRGADQVAAVYAILSLGACYVPLDMDQPPVRRRLIEESAGVGAVIATRQDLSTQPPRYGVHELAMRAPLNTPPDVDANACAYVIYTSGSTGIPKGVEVSHAAAMNTIDCMRGLLGVTSRDCMLTVSALDFDLSVFDLFGVLGAGGSLVLTAQDQSRDAAAWSVDIAKYGVTLWNSAPAMLEMLLSLPESSVNLGSLRAVLLSGDWVSLDLPERLRRRVPVHCRLLVLGGATEAGIWSNWQEVRDVPAYWRSIPYGRALTGQAYRVVDVSGRDVPDHVVGELWIGGGSLARGYRNAPELTAQRFVHDEFGRWYRTGDRGRFWSDGTLEFLGRIDQQVKVRGQRIELGEIETVLCAHDLIDSACVTLLTGTKQSLGAVVSLKTNYPIAVRTQQLPPEQCFGYLHDAEEVVTRQVLTRLMEHQPGPWTQSIVERWQQWLSCANPRSDMSVSEALVCLGWGDGEIDAMEQALLSIRVGAGEVSTILLNECIAPHAVIARLPDGREALSRLSLALMHGRNVMGMRVAVWDAGAGFGLDELVQDLLGKHCDVVLFDRSLGLLDAAARRMPDTLKCKLIDDDLLHWEDLGQFDVVVSFASLHSNWSGLLALKQARALLRPRGRLLLMDLLHESALAQLSATLLQEQPLRFFGLQELEDGFQAAGLEANCVWRSTRMALFEALAPDVVVSREALQDLLTSRLPTAMRPEQVWCRHALPLTANGKLDRRRLALCMERIVLAEEEAPSRVEGLTESEQTLAAFWAQLLKRVVTDRNASFFSLGGDSLLATRLLVRVREHFCVAYGMAEFYRQPTLVGMDRLVRQRVQELASAADVAFEEGIL